MNGTDSEGKMVPFIGPIKTTSLQPGEAQTHGFKEVAQRYFEQPFISLKKDWGNLIELIEEMLDTASLKSLKDYDLETVEIGLGFDANGKLAFIAEGGIQATIKVAFKRKNIYESNK